MGVIFLITIWLALRSINQIIQITNEEDNNNNK